MRFGFVMYPAFEELDLIGPWEIATMWRTYANGPDCLTISETGAPITCAKGLKVTPDLSFADAPDFDYLLVPGGFSAFDEMNNERMLAFLAERGARCRHVLSVCTGSFLLHAAGLLTGRRATTHWKMLPRLKDLADVVTMEERFVRDGNIWTSAGVSAGIDLMLAFIAAEAGEEAAGTVQWNAEYYPDGLTYGTCHRDPRSAAYFRDLPPAAA